MTTSAPATVAPLRTIPPTDDRPGVDAERMFLDAVWRNGRVFMMFSPLWAHVVGIDMSPTARLSQRMDLDLARCRQLALMRRAASLPDPVEPSFRGRRACVVHGRPASSSKEPVQ